MTAIRVLVADDYNVVRAGLRALLERLAWVQVVAEASDGREAVTLVATHQPDVVLMDISMPELNGLEATAQITRDFPTTRVLVLTMHTGEEYVLSAASGRGGLSHQGCRHGRVGDGSEAVARGDTYLSPAVSKRVVAEYLQRVVGDETPPDVLTLRQREVLQLLAEGQSTQDIAQKLNISVKTVEAHRAQLMQRLDIHDLANLVRYAIRSGLVKSE
jgi:DNA-binding NarL/FixJ family response regulator